MPCHGSFPEFVAAQTELAVIAMGAAGQLAAVPHPGWTGITRQLV